VASTKCCKPGNINIYATLFSKLDAEGWDIVNSAKNFLRSKFEQWYAQQIFEQGDLMPIKFPMNLMKPLETQWVMELYSYMLNHPEIIHNRFHAAGILDAECT